MSCTASKLVAMAKSFIGYNEADGSHRKIIDTYNAHKPLARGYAVKYSDAWCATFVSACAIKCGATDIIPTECSCSQMIKLFSNKGAWLENENMTPKVGDIVMYDWDDNGVGDNKGTPDHVGIVESVSGNSFRVIEGNISNKVGYRTMTVNGKYLRGFARPKYQAEPAPAPAPQKPAQNSTSGVDYITLLYNTMTNKYGTGDQRKQALGANYVKVQSMVNHVFTADAKTLAEEVMRGDYGTGSIRKGCLGHRYDEVQAIVNGKAPANATPTFKVGDMARPKTPMSYNGVKLASFVTGNSYKVIEVAGDRVVLDKIITAFKASNLTKV